MPSLRRGLRELAEHWQDDRDDECLGSQNKSGKDLRGQVRRGSFNLLRSVGGLGADYCEVGRC
jgi:hypothetical protein